MRNGSWMLTGPRLGCLLLACLLVGCADKDPGLDAPASAASKGPISAASGASTAKAEAPGSTATAPVMPKGAAAASAVSAALPKADVPGDLPALTVALSAEHTVGFFAAERPQELLVQIDKTIAALPDDVKADMPPPVRDPAIRAQTLGFDPTTAAGWLSAGLDPAGGAGLVMDARVEMPIIVIKIADRDAMLATLNRLGAKASLGAEADGITPVTIQGKTGYMGTRAGYTLLLPPDNAEKHRAAFAQVLKVDAPLQGDSTLKRTFSDGVRQLWISAWINGAALGRFIKTKDPQAGGMADFYSERFEAFGFVMGQAGGTLRLLAGAKGVAALRQLFVPAGAVPDFASKLTKDRVVLRVDLNFADFFDGVLALIPEEMAQPRSMVLMGKNAVPMAIGANFEQLGEALTGQIAAAFRPNSEPPIPVVMLGVRDVKATDTLLNGMTTMLKTVHKAPITEGQIGGHPGYLVPEGPMKMGLVRVDSMIYAGLVPDIEAALAAKSDLPGAVAAQVNGSTMLGFFVDFNTILEVVKKTTPAKEFEAMSAVAKGSWQGMLVDGFLSTRWLVDGRGLKLGDGASMMAFTGIAAAVAIPAFMKYIRRSKSAEASMHVRKMYDSAVAYHGAERADASGNILPRGFPATAPRTPATTACQDGKPVKHSPTPGMWAHPTWQGLNFAIDDPFFYQYEFISDAKSFTARVVGDLDCDGVLSTFERVGTVDDEGNVTGGAGLYRKDPLE